MNEFLGAISDSSFSDSTDSEEDQSFYDSFIDNVYKTSDVSLAERILFPPNDYSDNSTDEQSDWIVSDDEEYVDLKVMLAERGGEGKILYHPAEVEAEATRGDVFVADKELEDILSSPLIDAVCRVGEEGGVEAVRKVIAMHNNQYELDATDDKGNCVCGRVYGFQSPPINPHSRIRGGTTGWICCWGCVAHDFVGSVLILFFLEM